MVGTKMQMLEVRNVKSLAVDHVTTLLYRHMSTYYNHGPFACKPLCLGAGDVLENYKCSSVFVPPVITFQQLFSP